MSETVSKPMTTKTIVIQMGSMIFGILLAMFITNQFEQPLIGWFLGGMIMTMGALFAYKEKKQRFTIVNCAFILITGCITSGLYYLLT